MSMVERDFGAISGQDYPNNQFNPTYHRQVYDATHRGDGDRLPFMHRSFISFSFGGRYIEDFDLIATFSGDRMNRNGSASFEDRVSTYDILNGQKYWNTHYQPNSLEFQLSTDGIDQRTLEDFLYWFRAGDTKELILAEHPNRAILARLAEAPALNLLPFEHEVEVKIQGDSYKTKTTLYKGDINIKFIMDEPHWYAKDNILGIKDEQNQVYTNEWVDANGNTVSVFASEDALKILYEDGIPLGTMIQKDMLVGNGAYASVEGHINQKIWSLDIDIDDDENWEDGVPNGEGARIDGTVTSAMKTNHPEIKSAIGTYSGIIAGAIINADGQGINSLPPYVVNNPETCGYFYYSGTAPAPTVISFTITPTIDGNGYINSPRNSKTNPTYDTLTIESLNKQELQFTTPNIYTSFNKVIEIFDTYFNGQNSWEDIRARIREDVRHAPCREWAVKVIDAAQGNNNGNVVASADTSTLKTNMSYFLKTNSGTIQPVTFTFNSENGEATGKFKYRTVNNSSSSNFQTYQASTINNVKEEDVGDMLRSNYIILRDRNTPTDDGYITEWTVANKLYSHRIYHNMSSSVSNLSILYKNMYL